MDGGTNHELIAYLGSLTSLLGGLDLGSLTSLLGS
ncbi:hypothetical protein M2280_001266 [Prescottella agglutinans]|uniref:Uncharacterized protein n=1 Tax=Prescottella agglutinans TaxID=1644129 RepID=A0ABT6M6Z0_9NOCA|nr:hypothetical protein [Prescottella agglutinans]